jgi:hypothetical protein
LKQWQDRMPVFPDGSRRPLSLELIPSEGIQLAPIDPSIPENH